MNNEPIIKSENLTKKYGQNIILENVNFEVQKGEIFVIVGGSGCGKSTLLKQMIGLERPTEGTIYIDGEDFTNSNAMQKHLILRKFGILFQFNGLFASKTIGDNIKLLLDTYTDLNNQEMDEVVELKLAAVGLSGFKNYFPSEISGGMKKRAALARAMALDPDILFFDEPSSGLDPLTSASLDNLIIELNSGLKTTMVIVTHDLSSILNISHRIIMLDKSVKGIIAMGSPQELKAFKDNKLVYNFFNRIA